MEELVDRLVRWQLFASSLVTHRFPLARLGEACALMASIRCGKAAVCLDEEENLGLQVKATPDSYCR